jgi:hypothetical protein
VPYGSLQERMANVGTAGRRVGLLTNHFNIRMKADITTVYQYDFDCTFVGTKRELKKRDHQMIIRAFESKQH